MRVSRLRRKPGQTHWDDSRAPRSHLGAAASAMTASGDDVIRATEAEAAASAATVAMIAYDDVGDDRRSAAAVTAAAAAAGGRSRSPEPGRNRRCTVGRGAPVPSRSPCRRLLSDSRADTPCDSARPAGRRSAPRRAGRTPSAHDSDPHTAVPVCRVTVRDNTAIPTASR